MRGVPQRLFVLFVVSLILLGVCVVPPVQSAVSAQPAFVGHGMGYGVNSLGADAGCLERTQGMGFNWLTAFADWSTMESSQGNYNFGNLPIEVTNAVSHGAHVLVKIRKTPAWARPGGSADTHPPSSPSYLGNFLGALANALKDKGVAHEIYNEPNLDYEWGGLNPNPEYYVSLLKDAYPKIKAADPTSIVVTAGLATVGMDHYNGGHMVAMDDANFINRMYNAGAKGYFDALGSHPYGFAYAPEHDPGSEPLCFRRAEYHHQLMVNHGDGNTPIWATEFGWIVDPRLVGSDCSLNSARDWQKVSPQQQADYLVRAYNYAYDNWPWMGNMFVFNLDFNIAPWYNECEEMRYYSIFQRPAYNSLKNMSKPGTLPATLDVQPSNVSFMIDPAGANPAAQRVTVSNAGIGSFNWSVTDNRSWITVSPTAGSVATAPGYFMINVNKSGLSQGTHTGQVTVSSPTAAQSPQVINVTVQIGAVHKVYVPLVTKNAH